MLVTLLSVPRARACTRPDRTRTFKIPCPVPPGGVFYTPRVQDSNASVQSVLTLSSAKQEIHYLALHQNFNVTRYFLKKVYTKSCQSSSTAARVNFPDTLVSVRASKNRRSRVRRY
jgi:hypothetical protein